jgi:hypothetical protein
MTDANWFVILDTAGISRCRRLGLVTGRRGTQPEPRLLDGALSQMICNALDLSYRPAELLAEVRTPVESIAEETRVFEICWR